MGWLVYTVVKTVVILQLFGSGAEPKHELKTEHMIQGAAGMLLLVLEIGLYEILKIAPGGESAALLTTLEVLLAVGVATVAGSVLYRGSWWDWFYLSFLYESVLVLTDFFLQSLWYVGRDFCGGLTDVVLTEGVVREGYLLLFAVGLLWGGKRLPGWLAQYSREVRFNKGGGLVVVILAQLAVLGCGQIFLQIVSEEEMRQWGLLLMASVLFLFLSMLHTVLERSREKSRLQKFKLQLLEENYRELLDLYRKKASLLHDEKNHMRMIRQMVEAGESEAVVKYVSQLETELSKSGRRIWTNHAILDLLLNMKAQEAEAAQIFTQFVCEDMTGLIVKDVDLCVLIGNLLDNAIEANEKRAVSEKRWLRMECKRRGKMFLLQLENPVSEEVTFRGGIPQTTKEDKNRHGFGMISIRRVVDVYDGYVECSVQDGAFRVSLYLNGF